MNIIEMARESGMELYGLGKDRARFVHHLEAFYKLAVAKEREVCGEAAMKAAEKAIDVAMELEREACAKFVDHILKEGGGTYGDAIRARGTT